MGGVVRLSIIRVHCMKFLKNKEANWFKAKTRIKEKSNFIYVGFKDWIQFFIHTKYSVYRFTLKLEKSNV